MDPLPVSAREREVLDLLGDHLTHEQIGQRLFISTRTVESHVAALRRKLGVPDHRALVRFAMEQRPRRAGTPPPQPLTAFVGREMELAELTATLDTARLVCVVGPGGAGKTRLALAAATAADRVTWWFDLVPIADATSLEDGLVQACGAQPSSRVGPFDAVVATLRGQRVLLVLDNGEHLVNAVAVLVERLLSVLPDLTVLVTSRTRLALPFERVLAITGLAVDDAVQLFVDRAVAAGATLPSEADRARIGAICSALGGLALAVELAAVRVPSLGLDGVERGLLDQPTLLTGAARVTQRHRSMGETLDWSSALLAPSAAAVLRRLAVLVAPFDADAATAVAAFAPLTAADVSAALVQLTEHNLLAASAPDGRLVYRMLEPVRQYGIARMADTDQPAFEQHRDWCLRSVQSLLAADAPDGVRAVSDDVRAALGYAVGRDDARLRALARGFGLLLYRDGSLREAQDRLEQAGDYSGAAAIAKCRVLGEDALRLELAAASHAVDTVESALALARAAELLNRFPGMFAAAFEQSANALLADAKRLAPDDAHVGAAIVVATAGYAGPDGSPTSQGARHALAAASAVGSAALESSALDSLIASEIFAGNIVEAHRVAIERVGRLTSWHDPAQGLELKDALHVAAFCAVGAGDLESARRMAQGHRDLPFLREHRDLADDELMAPAALAGDWATAVSAGERFLRDWTIAGRPKAPGRALAPTAVALAYGLLGDDGSRREWLEILADLRGVAPGDASRRTGYGEIFESIVLLHEGRPEQAFDVLTAPGDRGMFGLVFQQWAAALTAEAAVLAARDDAPSWVEQATASTAGNPIAVPLAQRAAALLAGDRAGLVPIAAAFEAAGTPYQAERTRNLG